MNGPLPVLESVPDTFSRKLPLAVGVPDTVMLLLVLVVTVTPLGRPVTVFCVKGVVPPLKVKVCV